MMLCMMALLWGHCMQHGNAEVPGAIFG
jgi:hypothetical protein